MLGIGALLAGWITYGCYTNLSNDGQWRIPLGIQIIPAVVLATLILLFPESPRWLIDHDKYVSSPHASRVIVITNIGQSRRRTSDPS
jgi:MFS family permease